MQIRVLENVANIMFTLFFSTAIFRFRNVHNFASIYGCDLNNAKTKIF